MKLFRLFTSTRKSAVAVFCGALIAGSGLAQTTGTGSATDVTTLNNLLALQNAQSAFFTQGLQKFTTQDFAGINLSCNTNTPTYALLQAIGTQNNQQITSLQSAIKTLGGTAVQPCTYNFSFTTPQAFLSQALQFANASSSAYAGMLSSIGSADVRSNLATVAAVQARQSAYLDVLNAANPFPQAFEPTVTASDVNKTLQPFITSCPGGTGGTGGTGTGASVTAVAGPKTISTTVSRELTLDASGSTGPSGTTLTYNWSMAPNSSRSAAIINANTATPDVQFVQGYGIYTFNVTVTASNGSSAQDQISILYVGH